MLLLASWTVLASSVVVLWYGQWAPALGCYCLGALFLYFHDARLPPLRQPIGMMTTGGYLKVVPVWPIRLLCASLERRMALTKEDRFVVWSGALPDFAQSDRREFARLSDALDAAKERAKVEKKRILVRDRESLVHDPRVGQQQETWVVEPSGTVRLLYPLLSENPDLDDDELSEDDDLELSEDDKASIEQWEREHPDIICPRCSKCNVEGTIWCVVCGQRLVEKLPTIRIAVLVILIVLAFLLPFFVCR